MYIEASSNVRVEPFDWNCVNVDARGNIENAELVEERLLEFADALAKHLKHGRIELHANDMTIAVHPNSVVVLTPITIKIPTGYTGERFGLIRERERCRADLEEYMQNGAPHGDEENGSILLIEYDKDAGNAIFHVRGPFSIMTAATLLGEAMWLVIRGAKNIDAREAVDVATRAFYSKLLDEMLDV